MYQISIYNANTGKYIGCVRKVATAAEAVSMVRDMTLRNRSGTAVYVAEKAK